MSAPPPKMFNHATATLTFDCSQLEVYNVLALAGVALLVFVLPKFLRPRHPNIVLVQL
jgi:hypothetical protein